MSVVTAEVADGPLHWASSADGRSVHGRFPAETPPDVVARGVDRTDRTDRADRLDTACGFSRVVGRTWWRVLRDHRSGRPS